MMARQRTGEPAKAIETKLDAARADLVKFEQSPTYQRAQAFDRLTKGDALARHPELDSAYMRLQSVKQGWTQETSQDQRERQYFGEKTILSQQLHTGEIPKAEVSLSDSRRVIDMAGAYRGLVTRDAAEVKQDFQGEVVAISSQHALVKVSDMVAVRYERDKLDRDVSVGEKVAIQYGNDKSQVHERGKEPAREASMEQERGFR